MRKTMYFPDVRIDIQIDRDGSFTVNEYRTYDFRGRFSWASLWIPVRVERQGYGYNVALDGFSVRDEQGAPLRVEAGEKDGRFEAKWFYSARNERRTFHIGYRIRGGIVTYPDVTELYWQAIGGGWEKPTRNAVIYVQLPAPVADKSDILVYGHGPLSGYAEILDLQTARFTASNIRSGQFIEVRMAWPSGLVSGIPSNRHTRDSIKKEEARFVEETIAKAKAAQEAEIRRSRNFKSAVNFWLLTLFLVPLIWLPIYLKSWNRFGKDYRFPDSPTYIHEPPSSLQPALVETLLKEGVGITPKSFTATIFDLARRGYLEIQDKLVEKKGIFGSRTDYESSLTLKKRFAADPELMPYEKDLLDLIFGEIGDEGAKSGSRLSLDHLKKYFRSHPQKFQKWYQAWAKTIKAEAKRREFIEPPSLRLRNLFAFVTVPIAVLTFNPILAVLAAVLIPTLKRRTMAWARENEQWKAFDRFLDDFSNFKDHSAGSL